MAGWIDDLWWPTKVSPEIDFDDKSFPNLIVSRGIEATWDVAMRCPCGEGTDSAPLPGCPVCDGRGWFFPLAQDVILIAQGMSRDYSGKFESYNPMEVGELSISTRGEWVPAWYDRITLTAARMTKSAIMRRRSDPNQGEHVERLLYPISAMEYANDGGTTTSVDVIYLRPATAASIPGPPMVKGVDYAITVDGELDFTLGDGLGTAPARGAAFTIAYKMKPVFRVVSHPHSIRRTRTRKKQPAGAPKPHRLPCQFLARLEWMIEGL